MSEERVSGVLEALRASVEAANTDNVTDLASFRQQREAEKQEEEDNVVSNKLAYDVSPRELLEIALRDLDKHPIKKVYMTMISDDDDSWSTHNYRSCLTRIEEISFRQLGVEEALERWRDGKVNS